MKTHDNKITEHQNITQNILTKYRLMLAPYLRSIVSN